MMGCSPILSKCVPKSGGLRKEVMSEAYCSPHTVHPSDTKMYQDVKGSFWWNNMKQDIARFVEQCSTCQQLKAKHQRPARTMKLLLILKWKWDEIATEFILGLPKAPIGEDSIWVVFDHLTKSAHFISMKVDRCQILFIRPPLLMFVRLLAALITNILYSF
jgi:hypothetical protein